MITHPGANKGSNKPVYNVHENVDVHSAQGALYTAKYGMPVLKKRLVVIWDVQTHMPQMLYFGYS